MYNRAMKHEWAIRNSQTLETIFFPEREENKLSPPHPVSPQIEFQSKTFTFQVLVLF